MVFSSQPPFTRWGIFPAGPMGSVGPVGPVDWDRGQVLPGLHELWRPVLLGGSCVGVSRPQRWRWKNNGSETHKLPPNFLVQDDWMIIIAVYQRYKCDIYIYTYISSRNVRDVSLAHPKMKPRQCHRWWRHLPGTGGWPCLRAGGRLQGSSSEKMAAWKMPPFCCFFVQLYPLVTLVIKRGNVKPTINGVLMRNTHL